VGSRVELFEQIRRDKDREDLSDRALAAKYRVHRRTVRQALESPIPPARKRPQSRAAPKLGEYRELIDSWLTADLEAPRKQRHTAKRIWKRLLDEHGVQVAETTVRDHVRKRRRELGLTVGQVFVPQAHVAGRTAEVDWGQAQVQLGGSAVMVHFFVMRACFSGAAFCMASPVETQQAFLEGHALGFSWFGGVFDELRYDNLGSAVKKVLRGRQRVQTDRFIAMRSHYLFDAIFATPGIEGAHEKGGVEGEVGRFRRNHLVPVPSFGSIAGLNAFMVQACESDLDRRIAGRPGTVAEQLSVERPLLRRIELPFDATELSTVRVDAKALVTVRQNKYSVPASLAGLKVTVAVSAAEVRVFHREKEVARHERLHAKHGTRASLDHYLELLARKPGALARSLPLAQERDRGLWPEPFDDLWVQLRQKVGASEADRQMVDVLMLARELGAARVELAVRGVLAGGAIDGRAVAVLARGADHTPAPGTRIELDARLAEFDRPEPDLSDYDDLIANAGGTR
jgi:transposase